MSDLTAAWARTDSPIGAVTLIATDAGLVRVGFELEGEQPLLDVRTRLGLDPVEDRGRLEPVVEKLRAYFDGELTQFDLPLDWSLTGGFRGRVQRELCTIGYGETATYAEIATRLDNPNAVRAVGTGCATNPLPIVVPCHRVVRSDGSLGNYLAGTDVKQYLLELEASNG